MSHKQRGLLVISIFAALATLLSACTQSLSSAPTAKPEANPTTQFTSPIPENPLSAIETAGAQTAMAQTVAASGGTPASATPDAALITPTTPTNVVAATPAGVVSTPVPDGVRPATYTLQAGEFPYCIARRFNVDPDQLISLSGLTSPDIYYTGLALRIPQSGAFPGERSLLSHPATYTVTSAEETFYSIACKYGNVDPANLAALNNIAASAKLSAGQQIKIP